MLLIKHCVDIRNNDGITLENINVTNKGGLSAVADAQMIGGRRKDRI